MVAHWHKALHVIHVELHPFPMPGSADIVVGTRGRKDDLLLMVCHHHAMGLHSLQHFWLYSPLCWHSGIQLGRNSTQSRLMNIRGQIHMWSSLYLSFIQGQNLIQLSNVKWFCFVIKVSMCDWVYSGHPTWSLVVDWVGTGRHRWGGVGQRYLLWP